MAKKRQARLRAKAGAEERVQSSLRDRLRSMPTRGYGLTPWYLRLTPGQKEVANDR